MLRRHDFKEHKDENYIFIHIDSVELTFLKTFCNIRFDLYLVLVAEYTLHSPICVTCTCIILNVFIFYLRVSH